MAPPSNKLSNRPRRPRVDLRKFRYDPKRLMTFRSAAGSTHQVSFAVKRLESLHRKLTRFSFLSSSKLALSGSADNLFKRAFRRVVFSSTPGLARIFQLLERNKYPHKYFDFKKNPQLLTKLEADLKAFGQTLNDIEAEINAYAENKPQNPKERLFARQFKEKCHQLIEDLKTTLYLANDNLNYYK